YDRASTPVIPDGKMFPVGLQRGLIRTEQLTQICRVMFRSVEIDVICHIDRQMQLNIGNWMDGIRWQVLVDGRLDSASGPVPRASALSHKRVQGIRSENVIAEYDRQIDDLIGNTHTYTPATACHGEHPIRQVVAAKK